MKSKAVQEPDDPLPRWTIQGDSKWNGMTRRCREWNDEDTVTMREGVDVELEEGTAETGVPTGHCPL